MFHYVQQYIQRVIRWISRLIKYLRCVYYIALILLVKLIIPKSNLLIEMMTLDGLYNAVHSISLYMNEKNKDMTESQVIITNPLYTSSPLDRYIYYSIQYSSYKLLCWFFWLSPDINFYWFPINITATGLISCCFIITAIPPILNVILKSDLFNKIRKKKETVIKTIVSKQLANVIQFSSKTYLNKDIVIDYNELIHLFNNYDDTMVYIWYMITNTIIILVLNYVKQFKMWIYPHSSIKHMDIST